MSKHLTVLGILLVVFGALHLVGAGIVFLTVAGGGLLSGDSTAMSLGVGIGSVVASFLVAVSVPSLVAGIGLLRQASWSRMLALIAGGLNLLNIPFGTLLGVYAIWVLVQDESVQILRPAKEASAVSA